MPAIARLIDLAARLQPTGQIGDGMVAELRSAAERAHTEHQAPIPMVLFCPRCSTQHIDEANPAKGWDNPPHRSHECQKCGCIWRPCDKATVGVTAIASTGKADNWGTGEGATLVSLRHLAAIRLEKAVHECCTVPLFERGDYLAGVAADIAGRLLLRTPRTVGDICRDGPTNG